MAPKKRRTPDDRPQRDEAQPAQPPPEDLSTGSPETPLPLSPEMGDSGQRMLNLPVGVHTGPMTRSPEAPWLPPDVGEETEKRDERDRKRWELDPASSEDFERRQAPEARDHRQEGDSQRGEPTSP
jgi:hypothetical protein